jgi:uncharacterized protein involved in oxidation of intracellular sulfur
VWARTRRGRRGVVRKAWRKEGGFRIPKFLFVLHDPPYGTERTYNGLRWAREVLNDDRNEVKIFLFADAVISAMAGQKTPEGFYNIAKMLRALVNRGVIVGSCGTCLDARGVSEDMTAEGVHRSSMAELAEWTLWAEKIVSV